MPAATRATTTAMPTSSRVVSPPAVAFEENATAGGASGVPWTVRSPVTAERPGELAVYSYVPFGSRNAIELPVEEKL